MKTVDKFKNNRSDAKELGEKIINEAIRIRKEALEKNLSHLSSQTKLGKYSGCHVRVLIEFEKWMDNQV